MDVLGEVARDSEQDARRRGWNAFVACDVQGLTQVRAATGPELPYSHDELMLACQTEFHDGVDRSAVEDEQDRSRAVGVAQKKENLFHGGHVPTNGSGWNVTTGWNHARLRFFLDR